MARCPVEVAYCTDVEGNLSYFEKWVETAGRVVRFDSEGKELELMHEGAYFVYGGDVCDNGPGDLRLCQLLVSLKKRHPDRVALLSGNRDLNKLRMTAELDLTDLDRPMDEIAKPHWDVNALTLRQHLERVATQKELPGGVDEANTRIERLKYMLQCTMGCPKTFEFRREELGLLREVPAAQVTDDEVFDSFLSGVTPGAGGVMRAYLESSSLAALLGNTLFVHGAVDARSMGLVPVDETRFEMPPPGAEAEVDSRFRRYETVAAWVVGLNDFLRRGLADHAKRPHWDAARTSRGGEALLAAQNRCAVLGRSIIANCYSDGGNITSDAAAAQLVTESAAFASDPLACERICVDPKDAEVAAWLRSGGVRRLVVGHKPSGDCPAVLCSRYTGLEVISADLSFSDVKCADNRGAAVAGVLLQGETLHANHAVVFGTLQDGRAHEARLRTLGGEGEGTGGDPFVGSNVGDGWWVKALTNEPETGASYRLCKGAGRKVECKDVPADQMSEQ